MLMTITVQLSRIFWCMETVVEDDVSILQHQFPRWKTLGTVLQFDLENQDVAKAENRFSNPPSSLEQADNAKIPAPNDHMWVMAAWQAFAVLQKRCKDPEKCMRRGCDNDGAKQCGTCKEVRYCGEKCQKL